jgi:hypothetical protein
MTINCFFSGYSYFFKFSFVENFFFESNDVQEVDHGVMFNKKKYIQVS